MKQKVKMASNESFAHITGTIKEMIENGAEIVQLVNAGQSLSYPDCVIIYKK